MSTKIEVPEEFKLKISEIITLDDDEIKSGKIKELRATGDWDLLYSVTPVNGKSFAIMAKINFPEPIEMVEHFKKISAGNLGIPVGLNEWETDFIMSLIERTEYGKPLTEKQIAVLKKIWRKHVMDRKSLFNISQEIKKKLGIK